MTHTWSWKKARESSITMVDGVRVGHSTNLQKATGCTALVCDQDAVAGIDVRGGATASHEIELLKPCGLVDRVQGIMLTGGSAMGLACVHGAMQHFQEHQRGFVTEQGVVPIVTAAGLYDLGLGDPAAHPSHKDGYEACQAASVDFERGNVGAGTGAVVGKVHGHVLATKGGLGSAGWETKDGLRVGAVAAVNSFGDVLDPETATIIAGARTDQDAVLDTESAIISGDQRPIKFGSNTTLCVIATNAKLDKTQLCAVARIAQSGISRVVTPCHTQYDGDMVFALSMGDQECDINRVGVFASRVIQAAILDAVLKAEPLDGVPCARDLGWHRGINKGNIS